MDFGAYTWPPFYRELAERLLGYADRQPELIAILEELRDRGMVVTPLEDRDAAGTHFQLEEIDPFTFFGVFNRGIKTEGRIRILEALKVRFQLLADTPTMFDGLPLMHNMASWFISYKHERNPEDVPLLWRIFERALGPDPMTDPKFIEAFDQAVRISGIKINLTMGLFWIRPDCFLTLDAKIREAYHISLPPKGLTVANYKKLIEKVRNQAPEPFWEVSALAWERSKEPLNAPQGPPTADGPTHWMVGAYWSDQDPKDQTDRFLSEGLWVNGYQDKYRELVAQMKPGDKIAIKAATTKKSGLPFDAAGRTVSTMVLKARGTILALKADGRSVEVEWDPDFQEKEWFFYTGRPTVWKLKPDNAWAQQLIQFAWHDQAQDYPPFLQSWWGQGVPPVGPTTPVPEPPAPEEGNGIEPALEPYSAEDLITEGVFLTLPEVEGILRRWESKKNLILQGAPGVGKSFLAKKLAYALMKAKDDERITVVQFHPSTTYEDFIRGYRPTATAGAFDLQDGPFLLACQKAEADPDREHVIILDEINRGHVGQIFGELLLLIEADKRSSLQRGVVHKVTPLYRREPGETFTVPDNLHVIGTMNLADRSLALVDYALRRRFAFISLEPRFHHASFASWMTGRGMPKPLQDRIVGRMGALNEVIRKDSRLGKALQIGHSFFCSRRDSYKDLDQAWYREIVETEIRPLLEEYWYDDEDQADKAITALLEE